MSKIDVYIGKKYAVAFFSTLFAFILIFNLIHWIDHTEKFSSADLSLILLFYLNNIPQVINLVIPVCGLVSALLTFSNLGRYNELVALQVAGVSRARYILPVLTLAFMFSTGMFFFNEWIGVDATKRKEHIEYVEIRKKPSTDSKEQKNVLLNLKNNAIIQIQNVNIENHYMTNLNVQFYTDTLTVFKRIDADSAFWTDSTGWRLKHTFTRFFKPGKLEVYQGKELTVPEIEFKPSDLIEAQFKPDRMERFQTLKELMAYSEKRESFGQTTYHVDYEIYNTFFSPLSIFFMTFIGSVLGSIFTKGSVIIYFLLCIITCLIYIVIVVMGKVLGQSNDITPLMGAMLPHLVTLLILMILMNRRS